MLQKADNVTPDPTSYEAIERLLWSLAARAMPRMSALDPTMPIEDVVSQFSEVYCRCLKGYDASKGVKFSTYLSQSCWWEINRIATRLENERKVVSTTSVDSLQDENGECLRDTLFADEEAPSHEDVLIAREELVDFARKLQPKSRAVIALLARPSKELLAYCSNHTRPGDDATPLDLICKFLGLSLKEALDLRLELRRLTGVEFTRINPHSHAR